MINCGFRLPVDQKPQLIKNVRHLHEFEIGDLCYGAPDPDEDDDVEDVVAPETGARYPSCTAGRGACPPEDVGGPLGYPVFLAALADPNHPDHEHWTEWIGGGFDRDHFDASATDAALGRLTSQNR